MSKQAHQKGMQFVIKLWSVLLGGLLALVLLFLFVSYAPPALMRFIGFALGLGGFAAFTILLPYSLGYEISLAEQEEAKKKGPDSK